MMDKLIEVVGCGGVLCMHILVGALFVGGGASAAAAAGDDDEDDAGDEDEERGWGV
jgi:hypothetical protein